MDLTLSKSVLQCSSMLSIDLQIVRHNRNIERLQAELDSINEQIENQTGTAREKLFHYRELKHQAALALEQVSEAYHDAQSHFRRANKLLEHLGEIKTEHIELCNTVLNLAENEPGDGSERMLDEMKKSRTWLKQIYQQIRDMQTEAAEKD
jgi:hypothetical protein